MIEEFRKLIRDDVALFLMGLGCLGVGLFGAANWHIHCKPNVPHRSMLQTQESWDEELAAYHRKLEEVGKDAVIPWIAAMPLTFVGMAGCVIAWGALADRS